MHNKKVLSQAIKDLDKAKAPPKPKDIDYNSMMGFRDDSPFRNKSSMDIYTPTGTIDMSNTGMPLIANGQYLPPYSGTHQFDTNVVTEQPLEQAKKGFEINRPKTRNLKSKKYSRSLEATNELFTVHEFFQKPKSRKNKIYNPNAKYYKKGGGVDPAFEKKLEEVAKRLKVSKADLIGIMKHESGLNPSAVNPSTGATGLIQFMPATARALGTSTEALRNMSAVEQLDYVEKFYRPIAGKAKDIGDLYMFTFLPAAVGKPNDFVIGAKGSGNSVWGISQDALYRQNAGFDLNKKGYYTVGDVKTKISQFSGQPISKEKGIDLLPGDLKPGEEKVTFTSNPVEKEEVKNEPLFPLEYYMQQINPVATTPKSNPLLSLAPKRALNPEIQTELSLDEIKQYVDGGYIVEEIDQPEFQDGGAKKKSFTEALGDMFGQNVKDNWGRLPGDKNYGINPKTKKIEVNEEQKRAGAYGALKNVGTAVADAVSKTDTYKAVVKPIVDSSAALGNLAVKGAKAAGNYLVEEAKKEEQKKKATAEFKEKNPLLFETFDPLKPFDAQSALDKFVNANKPKYSKEKQAQIKAEEDKAVQDAILSYGMVNNPGKLDPEREEFVRNQVRAKYNLAPPSYYETQNEIDLRKSIIDPSSVLTGKSNKVKDHDLFMTSQQKAMYAIDKAAGDLYRSGAAAEYYKNDERGLDYTDMIKQDLFKTMQENKDPNAFLENIQKAGDERDYKILKDSYDKLPFWDIMGGQDKFGVMWKDFVADPLNVVEEAFWDKDYMPGRHMILRDPSHRLHNYYTKRTQMDQSPLSQGLQYINPFSSAAEAKVAINKGDYKEGAKQFGEGLLKTFALAAAPEVLAAGSSYVLPGAASIGLPGLTYTAALEGAGMVYGATQLPETYRSIEKAVKSGKKEDWRAAVNQTATNTLDFLGAVDFFKGIGTVPDAVTYRMLSKGSTATGFGKNLTKEAEVLKNLYNKNPAQYEAKIMQAKKTWEQAMDQVKVKYADKGYNFSAQEILNDPVKAQYLKDEFLKLKEEGLKFMKSDEGKKAVEKMFEEFPEFKKVTYESGTTPENIDEIKDIIFKEVGKEEFAKHGVENFDKAIKPAEKKYLKAKEEYENLMAKPDASDSQWMDKLNNAKWNLDGAEYTLKDLTNRKQLYIDYFTANNPVSYHEIPLGYRDAPFGNPDSFITEPTFKGKKLRQHKKYIPETPIIETLDDITYDDYIKTYEGAYFRDQGNILDEYSRVNKAQIDYENKLRELMQMDPSDPNYLKINNAVNNLKSDYESLVKASLNTHGGANYTMDNAIELGNKFLPSEGKTVLSHEIAHTNPQTGAVVKDMVNKKGTVNWNKVKPTGYVRRKINGKLVDVPYTTPIDKVLAGVDVLPAGKMGPGFNMQHYNFRVKPKEFIASTPDEITGSFFSNTDGPFFGPDGVSAKDYFLNGSNGNEKETFLAELKHYMLENGYGQRGKFTLDDVNEFWKEYLKTSETAKSDMYRLRILDILDPTLNTRQRIVKALNMPSGYEEGGEVDYDLGDEVDEATMKKLEKQGFVFQKIR